jgi:radical SAM PhpK family P-methyltransferase
MAQMHVTDDRLDCLVIGYNDPPMQYHEHRIVSQDRSFPERRVFMREHLTIEGRRLATMDVLNHHLGRRHPERPGPYYHVGEVPNLAAVYLTSYLRRAGFDTEFVSLFRPEMSRVAELLEQRRPRAVAITTTFYLMPWPVQEVSRFVAERSPDTRIVVGGPLIDNLVSDLEGDALRDVLEWMGAHVYVRESQGEATLARLLQALRDDRDPGSVPNVYVRTRDGFRFTRVDHENNDLDQHAIEWDSFADAELGPTVQTRTARSCAFKCSFCDFPIRAGKLSVAGVHTVERELRQLAARGTRHLVFVDDTFNVPVNRFKELCRMMIRNDFGFDWYSFFRCSAARDVETYDLMRESGCRGVFLGIESGDPGVLENMVKGSNLDQYVRGIERLHERDIITFVSFICGFPGETEASVANTIRFINETRPTFFRAELWFYNHRSPIHHEAERFGIRGSGYDWEHATMDVHRAGDAADAVFREATGSIWMPAYNYDFWSLPYLFGKGMTLDQVSRMHVIARDLMRFNDTDSAQEPAPGERAGPAAELDAFFQDVSLQPAKYHRETVAAG